MKIWSIAFFALAASLYLRVVLSLRNGSLAISLNNPNAGSRAGAPIVFWSVVALHSLVATVLMAVGVYLFLT